MTTLLLVVVVSLGFYHGIRGSIPLAGTLSLELGVVLLAVLALVAGDEIRARDLFLAKTLIGLSLICIAGTPMSRALSVIRGGISISIPQLLLLLIVPLILLALTIPALAIHRSSDSVFVAIFVLTAPYVGFLTTFFLDEIKPKARLTTLSVCSLLLPSVLLLVIWGMLGLDRLVVGSYAIGGLYGHLAILAVLLLWKRLGRLQAIGALVLLVLMSEVYLGGSRRYLLPVALSFLVCLCFININLKVIVGGLGCSVILLLFALGALISGDLEYSKILSSDSQMVSRGLGYRDAEFNFLFDRLDWDTLITGLGMGYQETNLVHGSKGVTDVGPRLHNFFLTVIMNGGILLLTCFTLIFAYPLRMVKKISALDRMSKFQMSLLAAFYVGWLISAWFDAPPDGLWPLGLCFFWIVKGLINEGFDSEPPLERGPMVASRSKSSAED